MMSLEHKKVLASTTILTAVMIAWQADFLENSKSFIPARLTPYKLLERDTIGSTCNISRFPGHYMRKEEMQRVASSNSTFVYSAYYDAQHPGFVKIVGICQRVTLNYYCQLWYEEDGATTEKIKMLTSNATLKLNSKTGTAVALGCNIFCPVTRGKSPFAVSIVLGTDCTIANNAIEVTYIRKMDYKRNFTMCLGPFHSNVNSADRLIEWIEFNRILGADHFLMYNFTGGQSLHNVQNYYVKLGLVEVLQWPLPRKHGRYTFHDDYSQIGAYNDCLLRSKAISKYVVVTDFDEFIVPRVKDSRTWMDMIRSLPKADAYTFRNCFFPISNIHNEFQYQEKEVAQLFNIVSLFALKRHKNIFPHGLKSKYITQTNTSFNLRTHYQKGAKAYPVDPQVGLLHHYRKGIHLTGPKNPMVIDKTVIHKYGHEIVNRVTKVWSSIRQCIYSNVL